jgi:hypothetical protein
MCLRPSADKYGGSVSTLNLFPVILSTDHELISAKNASLAAVHGSATGSNVRYYPTRKHSPI